MTFTLFSDGSSASGTTPARLGAGRSFIFSNLVGLLAICIVFGTVLFDAYADLQDQTFRTAANIAILAERDIQRDIEQFDTALQTLIAGIDDPKITALEPALRQRVLFDGFNAAHGKGLLVLLNDKGDILLDSQSATPRSGNFADRDYFRAHRDTAIDIGLYIGHPFRSRFRNGDFSIGISRRWNRPDGSFGGVATAALSLQFLQDLYQKIDLGKNGVAGLYLDDTTLLTRFPLDETRIGVRRPSLQLFHHLSEAAVGQYQAPAFDNINRFYAYRRVGNLPLVQVVGIATETVFASWWRKAMATSISLIGLCGVVLALTLRLGSELNRRSAAEQTLSTLATTDALTGLANRRKFEEAIGIGWRSALEDGSIFSVMMIDTDLFKSFNDTYGHQRGDDALREVARCIAASVDSSAFAARYGGEEFCVTLPGCDEAQAKALAETVRAAVAALEIPHAKSPHGVLTISAGVAAAVPSLADSPSRLVNDADRALYIAKAIGRNSIAAAGAMQGLAFSRPEPDDGANASPQDGRAVA